MMSVNVSIDMRHPGLTRRRPQRRSRSGRLTETRVRDRSDNYSSTTRGWVVCVGTDLKRRQLTFTAGVSQQTPSRRLLLPLGCVGYQGNPLPCDVAGSTT